MKALIRKYPTNAVSTENNEVWLHPWRNADEQGRPYTLDGYKYAMCENVPDTAPDGGEDPRMDIDNYTVTENTREVIGDDGETVTEKYWTAIYNAPQEATE